MTFIFYVILFVWITVFSRVKCQCSGEPKMVSVGFSTVLITPPSNVTNDKNSTLTCEWIARSSANASILLRVTDIKFPCGGGTINVYEGTNNSGKNLVEDECSSSGIRSLGYKISSLRDLFVSFKSDNPITTSEISFEVYLISAMDYSGTGCSITESLTATTNIQYLSSPNFPKEYPISTKCTWKIVADDETEKIEIKMEFLETEECKYDYLEIKESDKTIAMLCEDRKHYVWNPNKTYTSNGNNVTVIFSSDDMSTKQGFLLSYTQTDDERSVTTVPQSNTTTNNIIGADEQGTASTTTQSMSSQPVSTPLSQPLHDGDKDYNDNTALIVGVVIAGFVAIAIVIFIVVMYRKRESSFASFNVTTYSKQKDEATVEHDVSKMADGNSSETNGEPHTQHNETCVHIDKNSVKSDKGEFSKATDDSKFNMNEFSEAKDNKTDSTEDDLIKLEDGIDTKEDNPSSTSSISSDTQEPLIEPDTKNQKLDGLLLATDEEILSAEDTRTTLTDHCINKKNQPLLPSDDKCQAKENLKSVKERGTMKDEKTTLNSKNDNTDNVNSTFEKSAENKDEAKIQNCDNDN